MIVVILFSKSSHFALVHYDIWGSVLAKFTFKISIFVTFIDDYSQYTWLFLMKNHFELSFTFQPFYPEFKNQFGVYIRIFHRRNAHEYLSHSFQTFMISHDIFHQTSCAYTSQQVGVVKSKNIYLMETTQTFYFMAKFLNNFGGDVVIIMCYLINHISSSILDNQIPHSILFSSQPLHYLPTSSLWVYMLCRYPYSWL